MVCPSAAARTTSLGASVPIAPTRFSTTNCWPNTSLMRAQVTRARLSMLPPAAKPTNTRTGFCGQFCANADGAASDAANAAPDVSSSLRETIGVDVIDVVIILITLLPQQCGSKDREPLPQAQHGRRCGARSLASKVAAPLFMPALSGRSSKRRDRVVSVVAIDAFAPFVALLGLDRQRRDRTGFETAQRDRFAGLFAIAVGAIVDARDRGVDLGDQLALAIARPQLDRAVGFRGCAIGKVGMILVLGLEMHQRLLGLLEDVLFPSHQLLAKVFALTLVHERLFVGRTIISLVHHRSHAMAVLLFQ